MGGGFYHQDERDLAAGLGAVMILGGLIVLAIIIVVAIVSGA